MQAREPKRFIHKGATNTGCIQCLHKQYSNFQKRAQMDDLIGIDIRGVKEVQQALSRFPKDAVDFGADKMSEFIVDVLKQYPPRKSVTRKQAYGQTFQSQKQRRWFFAALRSGEIQVPYIRTQGLRNGWKSIGKGAEQIIVNEREGAKFVMGNDTQSRHESLVGWLTIDGVIEEHKTGILKKFVGGVKRAIKKAGLEVKE